MDNTVPKEAMENPAIMVKLCGKEYPFKEPKKRVATVMLGRALKLAGASGMNMDGGEIDLVSQINIAADSMIKVPDILDWIYDALKLNDATKAHIDDNFDFAELMAAFQTIVEKLQAPFVGSGTNSAPETDQTTP